MTETESLREMVRRLLDEVDHLKGKVEALEKPTHPLADKIAQAFVSGPNLDHNAYREAQRLIAARAKLNEAIAGLKASGVEACVEEPIADGVFLPPNLIPIEFFLGEVYFRVGDRTFAEHEIHE